MLTNSFCHIPGIGEKAEMALWAAGVSSWDAAALQESLPISWLQRSVRDSWSQHIGESIREYQNHNAAYFASRLPTRQLWRLYGAFHDSCAFFDIETTGLSTDSEITTAVLYDGHTIRHYVNGQNLDGFTRDLNAYALLVTYNGKCFDVRIIERFFGVKLHQAHIDLRYPLRSLGLVGGLKGCERQLGMRRPGMEEVDGFVAVLLWNEYRKRNSLKALETLLAYNVQDTIALHALMVHTHNAKVDKTPFSGSHCMSPPILPASPFAPDPETLAQVVGQWSSSFAIGGFISWH